MDYFGEHRLPGQLGHFFIVLSLVASLVATFSYFIAAQSKIDAVAGYWKKLARYAFIIETVSVFSIFGILFYIIQNHLFEYKYAWQHSSLSLEFKYMFACFWEGQEGSFLLWSVWHCVLGLILMKTARKWEAPVMTVVSFAQFCLATMLAGIYFSGWKMGSNPFILLRDSGVLDNAPAYHLNFDITQPFRQDYMSLVKDGNDLNPLLQNYWMVIHPPFLFLGFASTIVPFGYMIAGLWTKKFGEWAKAALPWALFSAAILGVGIMMGARWAYESLTFGGYWAWDPVENASLVPWLIMIAGIHTLLIYNHTGYSLRSTYIFFLLSFVFVLYSTFLTRSGILGETSVHAFTDLGMNVQLYLLLYVFIWGAAAIGAKTRDQKIGTLVTAIVLALLTKYVASPPVALISLIIGIGLIIYYIQTQVPAIKKEESSSSREFWMFIGSLVFFLSALVIIGKTSLPVFNKVFDQKIAPPEDPEFAYNQIQIFVAIIIAVLTGFSQYLKYKATPTKFFWKKIFIPTVVAVAFATFVIAVGNINYNKQGPMYLGAIWLAVACSIYSIIANAAYIWLGMKGKLGLSGGSIAHFGFGLVLLGILLSSSKKEMLSYNKGMAVDFGKNSKENPGENLTLIKGVSMPMGKFDVTYLSDSAHPKKQQWYYKVHFKSRTDNEEFTLMPDAFVNYKGNEGLMSNPSSRHYWDHDVFTYITSLPNPDKQQDTTSFRPHLVKPGDTIFYSRGYMILEGVIAKDNLPKEIFGPNGSLEEAPMKIYSKTGSIYSVTPKLAFAKGNFLALPDTVIAESLVLQIQKINPDKTVELGVKETSEVLDFVTLKAYKFPFINILWYGIIITAIGILMSMVYRARQNLRSKA
ncbi:MAG: cytochrome c biogenesis protein CcsA [Bacteroidota bacterium]|nr:cytochrome c biogenesis protein CcsA [Bacteroidota bacterium]